MLADHSASNWMQDIYFLSLMEQKVSLPHNRPPGQVLAVVDCGAGARDGETKLGRYRGSKES
jgi:hypothetical protein